MTPALPKRATNNAYAYSPPPFPDTHPPPLSPSPPPPPPPPPLVVRFGVDDGVVPAVAEAGERQAQLSARLNASWKPSAHCASKGPVAVAGPVITDVLRSYTSPVNS